MSWVEGGSNWGLEKGFLDHDLAAGAGRQAVLLNKLQYHGGTPFAVRRTVPDNPRRKVVRVDVPELEDSAEAPVFLRLIEAYQETEKVAVNLQERFHLDPFDSGGHTVYYGVQMEPEAEKTIMVCLFGRVGLHVRDPSLGPEQELGLEAGDALHINHFEAGEEPPTFALSPDSVGQPMVLVNG